MKGKLTDRFGKRMKRQTDRQVQEEDETASRQTGSRRMKRQIDRQVQEEDEKAS
jgi:hypothetical protein